MTVVSRRRLRPGDGRPRVDPPPGRTESVDSDPDLAVYRDRLRIDRNRLDEELQQQAALYAQVGERCALAASVRDDRRERLKRVDALLFLRIRDRLLESGDRFTEATLNSMVLTHAEHREAARLHAEAVHQCAQWEAMREAFQQRSYALKDLCQLFIAGYYTDTSVRGQPASDVQQRKYEASRERAHQARSG